MAEQQTFNLWVGGSNPPTPTKKKVKKPLDKSIKMCYNEYVMRNTSYK